ncbi:hypothetical protein BGZ70_007280 [Mortierella alpina]|uniref:F-box domain-containing protein n=1 Tax=Mortierella alpina TaxID=64518 RepID=A0A9P6JEH0_MORAP|nr:hypothetical protein BGZ70_007280 [Mortierella alpina]
MLVHLLSFLDAKTLVNVALVSKAWNKFASDNAVWRGLYFRHGWTVNHEMVDWYINAAEQDEEWAMTARDVQSRVRFESELSVSRGKRKMADCDMRDARDQDCGDYEMLHDVHDERSPLYDQYQDGLFHTHQHFAAESSPTALSEDVDMGHLSADEYDESSSPISIPPSSPTSRNTSASPEQSPSFSPSGTFPRRSSSTPSASPATTAFPDASFSTDMSGAKFDTEPPPIPRRIDFQAMNAPSPSEILSPDVLRIHRDPATHRAAINWKFLCKQRRMLEQNWNRGIHSVKEVPGHTEGIYCIQFDDQKIVSGSRDNTIKIWDMETGACRRTYVGHSASVLCLQYDEDRIVSGSSDATINVWDLNTGKVLQRLCGHADSVLSLRFEKDTVISCSKDRTVKIWKISTGEMLKTLVGHRAAVNAVQFSPESAAPSPLPGSPRVVVSASGDKSIKIWSLETGECLRTLEGHTRGIACIQFEGNVIVSGSSDKTIKIWDITKGECVKTLIGHEGLVRTLQFSGGRIISGSYDETLKIWEQESGRLLADLDGRHSHRVFKLQFNESKIVSCSQDQKIIIWDFAVGIDTTFF